MKSGDAEGKGDQHLAPFRASWGRAQGDCVNERKLENIVGSVFVCAESHVCLPKRSRFYRRAVINAADCLIVNKHMIVDNSSHFILTQLMLPGFFCGMTYDCS